jgi:DUF2075 family protein/DNA replication protein DnaC
MAITTQRFDLAAIKKLRADHTTINWPVVYMLENGKEMYIGETISAANRFKQHYERPERQTLTRAHIITDDEYNKSATLDIESWLIQYLVADNKFKLQNGNGGLSNHNYYDREKYKAKFEIIWRELQAMGLAQGDLVQLRNTDLFKYSPYKSLTTEQIEIVKQIEDYLIKNEHHTHIVSGEPGTGKSVLATYLVKYLLQAPELAGLKIALVIPQAGLRKTIQRVFSKIKGLSSSMVIGPSGVVGNEYDLLIVDEAHRLRRRVNLSGYGPYDKANAYYGLGKAGTQLDWILRSSKSQVLLYDGNQSVVPGDIRPEDLSSLDTVQYQLSSQLRVMAGNDYIQFIDNVLSLQPTTKPDFGEYDLRYFSNIGDMITEIKSKDSQHGLARLVAGYAWTWETSKGGDYDIELDGLRLTWNSTNIDWVNSKNAINEIGCIHTVQGYDLNYVGVIIGPELSYNPIAKRLIVDKAKYMDINGKRSIESTEELERYIINIYKTLLTRGIRGTYIHAVDKNLEHYLKSRLEL